jgi:hypothetical protein
MPGRLNRFTTRSIWAIEDRLATAERELQVQFARIAQLQAELDLVAAAIRRVEVTHPKPQPAPHVQKGTAPRRPGRYLSRFAV